MDELQFKIDGPILKKGAPLPITIAALSNFQSIIDKSYLVITDKTKITSAEREKFYLRATEFKTGSLLTYFDIALHGVQIGLPIVSNLGPQNIWDLTKDTFSFLKVLCEAKQKKQETKYEFNNNGDVHLHIGDQIHTYNSSVIQTGKRSLHNYRELAHLLGKNKLTEISASGKFSKHNDIYLDETNRNIFDSPSSIKKDIIELKCEVFDFNKYKNIGKLCVSDEDQTIPKGEYNFSILGDQSNIEYIYTLLKPEVNLSCLIEESINPFGDIDIIKLHVKSIL